MFVNPANPAAMTLGTLWESMGSMSSITGSALSSSTHSKSASCAFVLAAGRVDGRPFSTMAGIVSPRVLVRDVSYTTPFIVTHLQ